MDNYDNIISESIEAILSKKMLTEKFRAGEEAHINHEEEEKNDPTASIEVIHLISNLFSMGFLNVSAFARYVFPDHTPEGAQSQLRKAIEGLNSDGKIDKEHPVRLTDKISDIIMHLMSDFLGKS